MIIKIKELEKILMKLERLESLILINDSKNKKLEMVSAKKRLFPKYKLGDRTVYYKLDELYNAFKPFKR